jgi:hypothetical protein
MLADWHRAIHCGDQGGAPWSTAKKGLSKVLPKPSAVLYLNELWTALPGDDRRQTLATLSQIIAKRLQPPTDAKEVESDDR